jgi:small nuclear ribonucleoprotein (snRNP)-like protein
MSIGIPIKLLHEAQGHIITLELKTGQLYRGKLFDGKCNFRISATSYDFDSESEILTLSDILSTYTIVILQPKTI